MFEIIDEIGKYVPLYLLVFGRISALVITMPILGYATVSTRIRVALALILTMVISPLMAESFAKTYISFGPLVLDMAREIFIGMLIGFGARLVFEGFSVAGSYIGMQMGIAMMNVYDPSTQNQQPIISNFWLLIIMIFFLVTNTHHFLIETIFQNFKTIGLGSAQVHSSVGHAFVGGGTVIFDLALKFAAPAMIFLLSVDVALAFMARVMPQLNIFFIGLPLKIGTGIFLLVISLNIFQGLFVYVVDQMEIFVINIVQGIK